MIKLPEEKKEEPKVRISSDDMQAYLRLPEPEEGTTYTVDDLVDILKLRDVVMGIDQDALNKIIEEPIYGKEVAVASGKMPVPGQDGYFRYNFRTDFSLKPKEKTDGSVDYWSINTIETVVADQVIAMYIPAMQGEDGYTVKGRVLPTKRGKEQQPLRGTGFSRSEDNLTYTALTDGKIDKTKNRITITPIYEIYGNVDLKTGNIDFRGDLVIHGNISSEAKVSATGSIVVDGVVEGAEISAGADIIFRGGVLGAGKAKVTTKGSVYAQFLEFVTIEAEENIQADVFLDCRIIAGGKVYATGSKGYIVGGNIHALQGIEAERIGNAAELRTEIRVGLKPDVLERIMIVKKQIRGLQENIVNIESGLKKFDKMELERGVSYKEDPRRLKLLRAKIQCSSDLSVANHTILELEKQVEDSRDALIKVFRIIHPGVIIYIDCLKVNIVNIHESVTAKRIEDKIVLRRIYENETVDTP